MARMHGRARGKSGSTKPVEPVAPAWMKLKAKEVETLVLKYAKEGRSPSQIGMRLRDAYGIPDVKLICGKSITKLLEEKKVGLEIPEDLRALIKKSVLVRKHIGSNKQDMTALRGLQLTESKIRRLMKYYKVTGKLDKSWKYDPERVKLYAE
ncbi:MAG: 30S ribosomal protein S15 [Candidatus Woesearchaeota archaeon]